MLRQAQGARRFNELVELTKASVTVDDFGHRVLGTPETVAKVYACVRRMSATKAAMTFQIADVVGVELEFRDPCVEFNGITWNGRQVVFPEPHTLDNRGRIVHIDGYYQVDNPGE